MVMNRNSEIDFISMVTVTQNKNDSLFGKFRWNTRRSGGT